MVNLVKRLVADKYKNNKTLDVTERNLLSVAYKNVVGYKRASWRTVSSEIEDTKEDEHKKYLETYQEVIAKEIETKCLELIDLLNTYLIPNENETEASMYYIKMVADYYRYLSEIRPNNYEYRQHSLKYYEKSMENVYDLAVTHPTRLGLLLSYSVQYYEILNEPEKAIEIAQKAFDAALAKLQEIPDSQYKDSTLIMQLMRDNVALWTSEEEIEKERKEKQMKLTVWLYKRDGKVVELHDLYEIPNIVNRICIQYYV